MVGQRRNALPAQGLAELLDSPCARHNRRCRFGPCDARSSLRFGARRRPCAAWRDGCSAGRRSGRKRAARAENNLWTISARVGASAVAVTAMSCMIADRSRHLREAEIFGPEIMAPLRDAMGLVDGEDIGSRLAKKFWRIGAHQPFRRDIDEAITFAAGGPPRSPHCLRRCSTNSTPRRRLHGPAIAALGRASRRSAARRQW